MIKLEDDAGAICGLIHFASNETDAIGFEYSNLIGSTATLVILSRTHPEEQDIPACRLLLRVDDDVLAYPNRMRDGLAKAIVTEPTSTSVLKSNTIGTTAHIELEAPDEGGGMMTYCPPWSIDDIEARRILLQGRCTHEDDKQGTPETVRSFPPNEICACNDHDLFHVMMVMPSRRTLARGGTVHGVDVVERVGIGIVHRRAIEQSLWPGPVFEDVYLL